MSYTIDKSTERLMPHGWCWNGARIGSIKEMTDGLSVQIDRDRVDGENIIKLVVSERPKFAGIDPFIKLIDRDSADNIIGL